MTTAVRLIRHQMFLATTYGEPTRKYSTLSQIAPIIVLLTNYLNDRFSCPYDSCGKEYAIASSRDGHVRYRYEGQQYACQWQDCLAMFSNERNLRIHEGSMHTIQYMYT